MAYGSPMFYLVTRALGEAMRDGSRIRPRGTVYGIYKTRAAAEAAQQGKRVFVQGKGETLVLQPTIIVEQ